MTDVPDRLSRYVPTGHRLWFSPAQDPDAGKPDSARNPNATGGTNRRAWIVCVCGNGTRVEGEPVFDDWLSAVNQCRLAVHSLRQPCLPINAEGVEQAVRDAPPAPEPVKSDAKPELVGPPRGPGRPRKEA